MIKRICKHCGKEFFTYNAWLRNGKAGNYCSKSCASKSYKRKKYLVKKNCVICGKEFWVKRYRKNTALYCSVQCRAIDRGRKMRGKNHPNWKGGISERDWKFKKWAKKVKQRDNYTCQKCGYVGKEVEAHHLKKWHENIELRYNINNGITLCRKCHSEAHKEIKNFILKGVERSGINKICLICGKEFYVPPYKIKTAKTCSRSCAVKYLNLLRKQKYEKEVDKKKYS